MPSLFSLTLSHNKFSGQISEPTNQKQSSKLVEIDLQSNHLEGPVPQFLFEFQELASLSLSRNQFNGTLELINLGKLPKLVSLHLSYNNLVIYTNSAYSEQPSLLLPNFETLMLASCGIRNFPLLKNQSIIMMLDLSNNRIAGEIPNWLWGIGDGFLHFLNLSHNQLTHFQEPYTYGILQLLDLRSNFLTGRLPTPPWTVAFMDLSSNSFVSSIPADIGNHLKYAYFLSIANNKITGGIPKSFCNASRLQMLNLSNNALSNTIPPCLLENGNNLGVLNVGRNNFSGYIPGIISSSCSLETLDLSWNNLEGQIPDSLSNCSNIKVLNLGSNRIDDNFPCWINKLTNLHVLSLLNNHFHGSITCPGNNYTCPNLQILDLALNNFTGDIPRLLFSNLKTMTVEKNDPVFAQLDPLRFDATIGNYYQDSVSVILKGLDTELQKILIIFTSIDFSSNQFHGNLPETVGELQWLYLLNLSHNHLTGSIPPLIGNLKKMGSLDLSFNHLEGKIPAQISVLTFLSFLNLSYNELVRMIPVGGQMHTFTESSSQGNIGLCGFALNTTCPSDIPPEFLVLASDQEEESVSNCVIFISAVIGFNVSLIVFYESLLCCKDGGYGITTIWTYLF